MLTKGDSGDINVDTQWSQATNSRLRCSSGDTISVFQENVVFFEDDGRITVVGGFQRILQDRHASLEVKIKEDDKALLFLSSLPP